MAKITYDPERFQLTIARITKGGHVFEVVINPDAALAYREGRPLEIQEILKADKVFVDAQRGQLASHKVMDDLFGTHDAQQVAEQIIRQGELHFTARFRQGIRERKLKEIIHRIHLYGIDPRTNTPHPLNRIERALKEAKIRIDEYQSSMNQLQQILKKLQPILPIIIAKTTIQVVIPAPYVDQVHAQLKKVGEITGTWTQDGSWAGKVVVPAGLVVDVTSQVAGMTHGKAHTEIQDTINKKR